MGIGHEVDKWKAAVQKMYHLRISSCDPGKSDIGIDCDLYNKDIVLLKGMCQKQLVSGEFPVCKKVYGSDYATRLIDDLQVEILKAGGAKECVYYTDPVHCGQRGPHSGSIAGFKLSNSDEYYTLSINGLNAHLVQTKELMDIHRSSQTEIKAPMDIETQNIGIISVRLKKFKSNLHEVASAIKQWIVLNEVSQLKISHCRK